MDANSATVLIDKLRAKHGTNVAVAHRLGITPTRLYQVKKHGASGPLEVLLQELTKEEEDRQAPAA